ncbi:MAG: serine/threonine-protein phosphatase, partial [Treponema sp.]|nr:serine/threonine-protein phosphatase [Treponema sp.]
VTCWFGIFCFSTRELRFVNAGHPFPVIFKKDSDSFEFLKEKPGFVLGGMENVQYKEYSVTLERGERIFIYTDGVTEATNKNEELFGDERLLSAMNGTRGKSAPDTLLEIRRAIDSFAIGAEQFDDITMMSFELK